MCVCSRENLFFFFTISVTGHKTRNLFLNVFRKRTMGMYLLSVRMFDI